MKKKVRIAINGFGRIGRQVLKEGLKRENLEFVAINDLADSESLAHLYKYDSIFGITKEEIKVEKDGFLIDGKKILTFSEKEPAKLPWKNLEIDYVVEATGVFTDRTKAQAHIDAGAKRVVITAPGKGTKPDVTIVLGINDNMYDPKKHFVISNASCTTNCFSFLVKVVHENFKIQKGEMTTIHSYTNDQRILDQIHKDLRRARAAALNIIPTSTGAAEAIELVYPELKGKLKAVAIRVPTPTVSLCDFTAIVEREVKKEEVNEAFKKASQEMPKYLEYCDKPLVSSDFIGNPHSCIFDATLTETVENLVKVAGWYDNEWGYSVRVVDLLEFIAEKE
ncbi:MAG: type I glyceraldehyde-3-phosphate dehydrogenase [Candidatus Hydrothermales bacterium]